MDLNNWKLECRIITENDRNQDCPITMDTIEENELYCQCSQCQYNIKKDIIQTMYKNKMSINCPMCRLLWKNKVVYVNGSILPFDIDPFYDIQPIHINWRVNDIIYFRHLEDDDSSDDEIFAENLEHVFFQSIEMD